MSRGQSGQAFDTSEQQSATNAGEAASSFGAANDAINSYTENLSKFMSSNPYTQGGEYDKTILPQLAETSDAGATSLKGALQSQALRTGENAAGSAATASEASRQATRDLSTADATAEQARIAGEAGYNQEALQDSSVPIQAQDQLYGTSTSGTNASQGNAVDAAKTPSFFDTLGDSFGAALGKTLGGGNSSK